MERQIRGVLLDLGDTLVHLDKPWEEVFEQEVRSLFEHLSGAGVKVDFRKFSVTFVQALEGASSKASLYRIEIPMEETITNVVGKFGVHKPNREYIHDAVKAYYRPEIESWQLFPDTIETLNVLDQKGYLLGLISNAKSDWQVNSILNKFDLSRFFKLILISASLRIRKPKADIFLKALNDLHLTPQETVFIGNSIDADVIGPSNVGIHAIHIQRQPPEHGVIIAPEATVTNLSDAAKTVNNWSKIN